MNKISKFIHELFNPHCIHCKELREEESYVMSEANRCRACESLERQLSVLIEQNNNLINKIGNSNSVVVKPLDEMEARPNKIINRKGSVPFSVLRQSLESESRAAASAIRNAAQPNNEINKDESIDELEKMVLDASTTRTEATGTKQ